MSDPVPLPINDLRDQREVLSMFRIAKRQAVVPWLEENITLPVKMAPNSHGPFRARRIQRPILECWSPDSGVNHCAVSGGTQLLKTTILVLGAAYRIVNVPLPMLLVGASAEWTKEEIGEKRLQPLIDENPILEAEKPADGNLFRAMSMAMNGGVINLRGGNSPNALAGGSFGIVAIDEASKLTRDGGEQAAEAHPLHLAEKRTDAFGSLAFHYLSSTPNSPSHPFWQKILSGDQTHFYAPCPHCREWFYFDFMGRPDDLEEYGKRLGLTLHKEYKSVKWDKDARTATGAWIEEKVRATARFICPFNGCEITENERLHMVDIAEEKRHHEEAAKNRRSFILPSFYSPTITTGTMAWDFLKSQQDFFGLQDFYNSRLARPWTEIAAQVKDDDVRKLRYVEKYVRRELPRKPHGLVLCADVGDYKTHWIVGAVFSNDETAVIDWGTVLTPEELIPLGKKLKYQIQGTEEYLSPSRGLVDAKDQTMRIYNMCQASQSGFPKWFPCSGSESRTGSWGKQWIETHCIDRYTFNSFGWKKYLYIDLIKKQKSPRLMLPADADEDLIAGLSGQQLIVEKGKEDFKKLPNDHYGDCVIRLQVAMAMWRAERGGTAPDMT